MKVKILHFKVHLANIPTKKAIFDDSNPNFACKKRHQPNQGH